MQLLAAAEAPFSDPFLMEFEDSQALQDAYGGNAAPPTTFEQALMQARLEARQTAQASLQPLLTLAQVKSQLCSGFLELYHTRVSCESTPAQSVQGSICVKKTEDGDAPGMITGQAFSRSQSALLAGLDVPLVMTAH